MQRSKRCTPSLIDHVVCDLANIGLRVCKSTDHRTSVAGTYRLLLREVKGVLEAYLEVVKELLQSRHRFIFCLPAIFRLTSKDGGKDVDQGDQKGF